MAGPTYIPTNSVGVTPPHLDGNFTLGRCGLVYGAPSPLSSQLRVMVSLQDGQAFIISYASNSELQRLDS